MGIIWKVLESLHKYSNYANRVNISFNIELVYITNEGIAKLVKTLNFKCKLLRHDTSRQKIY